MTFAAKGKHVFGIFCEGYAVDLHYIIGGILSTLQVSMLSMQYL
jgi:hypothetical protein